MSSKRERNGRFLVQEESIQEQSIELKSEAGKVTFACFFYRNIHFAIEARKGT